MPHDRTPSIDDSELDENPFYLDAEGNPQVRDVGGFAPIKDDEATGLVAPPLGESSPVAPGGTLPAV